LHQNPQLRRRLQRSASARCREVLRHVHLGKPAKGTEATKAPVLHEAKAQEPVLDEADEAWPS